MMQVRYLFWSMLLTLVLAVQAIAGAKKAELERPAGEGAVDVSIEGLRSTDGILFVSLYLTNDGFPGEWQRAWSTQQPSPIDAVDGVMTLSFENVPAGWFVIAVLHDADGNSEMAMNALGIPKESYGFSQNPKSLFGPPDFDKAAVYLEPGQRQSVSIKLKH